jgi:hypothetical protein
MTDKKATPKYSFPNSRGMTNTTSVGGAAKLIIEQDDSVICALYPPEHIACLESAAIEAKSGSSGFLMDYGDKANVDLRWLHLDRTPGDSGFTMARFLSPRSALKDGAAEGRMFDSYLAVLLRLGVTVDALVSYLLLGYPNPANN